MKKYLFVIGFFSVALTSAAQLKVQSDGKVVVTRNVAIQNADFSIGEAGFNSYNHYRFGMLSQAQSTNFYCIGVSGKATGANAFGTGCHIGIQGLAGNNISNKNYGVLGGLTSTNHSGAGIFGTTTSHLGVLFTGCYAGYFDGATYVDGTLTANDIVTPSDIRLKENVTMLSDENEGSSTLDNLMNLNVIHYNYKAKKTEAAESDTADVKQPIAIEKSKVSPIRHYGLSAQQLQTIYPDLVRKGQDGYLGVNYVELVPILIQSIQELKAELDEVKGSGSGTVMKARQHGTFDDGQTSGVGLQVSSSGNVLFQNTPNPFTERTEIRFTLSDDARNAYIYIFDMTGKTLKQIPVDATMQSVTVGGNELSSGIYLYSLVVNGQEIDTKRMILSK